MHPDKRFHGRVQHTQGQIPWTWSVVDAMRHRTVAWGEEFHHPLAVKVCREAVGAARTWYFYVREDKEQR